MKGNVKAPPQTPQSTSSSPPPPTSDDARPYVLIRGKRVEVPKACPKGAKGRLVNNQRFIEQLDIRDTCAPNSNPRAKLRASNTKTALIYKRVFPDCL